MALNLWGLSQPTSYNPLPTGLHFFKVELGKEYMFSFKIKSEKGATLRIAGYTTTIYVDDVMGYRDIPIDSNLKHFSFKVEGSSAGQLSIQDINSTGDIIIEDITLVEKPLPSLTINGIDGFQSGKWNLHANATVIDDETLELNATANYQGSFLTDVSVKPNSPYVFSGIVEGGTSTGGGYLRVEWLDKTGNYISYSSILYTGGSPITTTSPANADKAKIHISNTTTGKFTFKRPMLVLGTTPIPYEPKRGERMVPPVPKKNLFDGEVELGNMTSNSLITSTTRIRSKNYNLINGNETYQLSDDKGYSYEILFYDSQQNYLSFTTLKSFVTPSNTRFFKFKTTVDGQNDTSIKIMLNKGTYPTPYEPYAVQLNLKPKRYVPKKNLIPSFRDSRWQKHANLTVVGDYEAVLNATGASQDSFIDLSVKGDMYYTPKVEMLTGGLIYVIEKDSNGGTVASGSKTSGVSFKTNVNTKTLRFILSGTTTGQFTFKEPILTEGSTAQPFEPYEEVLPKAKTGLRMDGTQYVQLPSMTITEIEIDCLIDSVQPQVYPCLLDARSGLSNSQVYTNSSFGLGFGDGVYINSEKYTSFPTSKLDERVKILAKHTSPFTDDVNIFSHYLASSFAKGTIYGVKCYLNGQVVAEYDFSNPNNIVGDKLIQNAQNLIPSFDSGEWSLHSNFKVFGPNVGRLDATANTQRSTVPLEVKSGETYELLFKGDSKTVITITNMAQTIQYTYVAGNGIKTFTVPDGVSNVLVRLDNLSNIGSFDFIKPQLYELTGKEAQLFGSPTPQLKAPKRILYARR